MDEPTQDATLVENTVRDLTRLSEALATLNGNELLGQVSLAARLVQRDNTVATLERMLLYQELKIETLGKTVNKLGHRLHRARLRGHRGYHALRVAYDKLKDEHAGRLVRTVRRIMDPASPDAIEAARKLGLDIRPDGHAATPAMIPVPAPDLNKLPPGYVIGMDQGGIATGAGTP